MSERQWWKGDLIASILVVLLTAGAAWVLVHLYPNEPEIKVVSYKDAAVMCVEVEKTPWEVSACQWSAYESFYGTEAATAAWNYKKGMR